MKTCKNILLLFALLIPVLSPGQKKKDIPTPSLPDLSVFNGMEYRSIGPYRGGRSAAVTGVPGKKDLYYFGSTGGGVWKTTDGGLTWENISDGFFGGSIGAVTVSEFDANVIYVGGGEKTLRGNVSFGYGIWKSVDAGKTWNQSGLKDARHISRIRIHPKDADLVYAAVIGDIYKPSQTRGVYKSTDGGITWKRVLFANDRAGAVDLVMDPENPRILYASTWRAIRTPYSFESGGEGSALWKSTDAGETWTNMAAHEGFPKGTIGIIGITVSPVNHDRVWAIIEAEEGGVFRSDDGGNKWTKLNDNRNLRQRAWYYSRIYADTQDPDKVYVVNVQYHRSKDGGKTFEAFSAPHGDHHDLWIDPDDSNRMIIADDGGAQVSEDGGETWTTYHNQPTGQFYRVTTDNHFPYRIYGAQQDNSTVRIHHRTDGNAITEQDWETTAGSESGHIAVDPLNNDMVYGGNYGGYLERFDHKTNQSRLVDVWPDNPMGYGAEGAVFRFQWNFPLFFSPHNQKKLYACSNHLHVTYNEGQSWETISPDLTRNDKTKLGPSGGPITKDNTGVEYYCTIFAAAESPHEEGVIWTGSDDGLLNLTRDGGKTWTNVTPAILPEWLMINSIEIDPFEKGGVYVAGTLYKSGDYKPYLFKTKDYGKTWQKITNGMDGEHFTRVLKADPAKKGLLYCGTESGMYISYDDGQNWLPFQLNLPVVPVTDLTIKNDNLVMATQGRGFWILDDLNPVRQFYPDLAQKTFYLFSPLPSYRMGGSQNKRVKNAGLNHPGGVLIHFYLKEEPDSTLRISLKLMEKNGRLIKTFSTPSKGEKELLKVKMGFNQFAWNMRYPDAKDFEGMVLWSTSLAGPKAMPGEYLARLVVNQDSMEMPFTILPDPRVNYDQETYKRQFEFLMGIRDKVTEAHQAILNIRSVKKDLGELKEKIKEMEKAKNLLQLTDTTLLHLSQIEEELYQVKNRSGQDPLNYPIRLTNKLAYIMTQVNFTDSPPTLQQVKLMEELTAKIDIQLDRYRRIIEAGIPEINRLVKEADVDAVRVDR